MMASKEKIIQSIYSQIKTKILTSGPITVAEYMRMALTQPRSISVAVESKKEVKPLKSPSLNLILPNSAPNSTFGKPFNNPLSNNASGYYMNRDVFGAMGDFITNPEISQIYGELIGCWALQSWMMMGGPKDFNIVELGPGRGTMAKDILRVFHQFEHLTKNNVKLHLVEISPFLANIQYKTLCSPHENVSFIKSTKKSKSNGEIINPLKDTNDQKSFYHMGTSIESGFPVYWYRDVQSLPKEFCFYIAHEFFDALPIHKLQRVNGDWREILVDLNPESENKLRLVVSRNETPAIKVIRHCFEDVLQDSRSHIEVSLDASVILEELKNRIESKGGLGLIIDYGHDGTKEDTFRGFLKHKLHDPLIDPGTADLTADVDFSFFRKVCQDKLWINGPITQKDFLERIGINLRLQKLLENCTSEELKKQHISAHKMLIEDMGERFKFLALFPKVLETYSSQLKIPGFYQEEEEVD